jgi:hypothetical protein
MKRPAHGAFNGKGGSSSSSFAKLCSGSFRVGSGFHLKRQGRFILFSGHFIQNEYYYKDGLFTPKKQVF